MHLAQTNSLNLLICGTMYCLVMIQRKFLNLLELDHVDFEVHPFLTCEEHTYCRRFYGVPNFKKGTTYLKL